VVYTRDYRRVERPPAVPILVTVLIVSILVEFGRFYIHGSRLNAVAPTPRLLAFACICANLWFHAWNAPDATRKAIVSSLLSEAGMFNLLAIIIAALQSIFFVIWGAFGEATAPVDP
jgi:hypothetical protein